MASDVLGRPPVSDTQLYVSPDGNDAWSGRLPKPNRSRTDGPLASLTGARDAVRRLKARGPLTRPVRVTLAGGEYWMNETFELTAEDSGGVDRPVIYEAARGAKPVFSGGRLITGWERAGGGIWKAKLPLFGGTNWYFEQLWVNGRRAQPARSPNMFYYYVQGRVKERSESGSGERVDWRKQAFKAKKEDIEPLFSLDQQRLSNVTVVVYHSWEISRHRVARVDKETGTIYFTGPAYWPFARWGNGQRYYIEGFLQALDSPGEWYLDIDGTLYYYPRPGEEMPKAKVIAPVLFELVRFKGEPSKGRFVENIVFDGLSFSHNQYVLPRTGNSDPQAALWVPGAIMLDGARNVTIKNGVISHVGTYAVWFREGCRDCVVREMLMNDLGTGGVKIGEQFARRDPMGHSTRVTVENNIIRDGGLVHAGAVGVWIGQSGGNTISHNEISDLFYSGVSVGWMWDYGRSLAVSNRVEFNHIHHLGKRVLSDLGGIYTLGVCTGTVIRNNVIHDIEPYDLYGAGGFGIYLDAASSGIRVENNLTYRTKHSGLHLNFGRDNVAVNNIFAFGEADQLRLSVVDQEHSLTFRRNIVYWRQGRLIQGDWKDGRIEQDENLYWNASGGEATFVGMNLKEWQKRGRDRNSLIADPKFRAPDRDDFRLRPDSPAMRLGFVPFDPSLAGVHGTKAWRRLSMRVPQPSPTVPVPPPPPPLSLKDGFEDIPVGSRPDDATVFMEFRGESVAVTNELAAEGNQCLKVKDAPGLEKAYLPVFFYVPNHRSGTTRVEFDLRLGVGAFVSHEWRDAATPYLTGPSFTIINGRLQTGGRDLLVLPTNVWVRVAVQSPLQERGTNTWSLTVTMPDKAPVVFANLPPRSSNWRELQRLGFLSYATNNAVFYIDNLVVENHP